MSKEIKLDFCIIPNSFEIGGGNAIFITNSNENFLNRKIIENKEYKYIKEVLEKFGYIETEILKFECENNENQTISEIIEIRDTLEGLGLSYNTELEINISNDLNNFKNPSKKIKNKLITPKNELFKFKHKEPGFREKIVLNFYLFLEFGFNQKNPIVQFGGDFKDSYNYDDRNYIKIVESEFERVRDPNSPNSIVLKSIKKQKDFFKESGMLYSGFFKYKINIEKEGFIKLKDTTFKYKLTELKKFLNPEQSIVVETNRMGYDKLIKLSNKIKTESKIEGGKFISTGEIEREALEVSKFLTNKMVVLSDNEEFEGASKLKGDVELIQEKIEFIKNLDKLEITTEEYFDLFSIT